MPHAGQLRFVTSGQLDADLYGQLPEHGTDAGAGSAILKTWKPAGMRTAVCAAVDMHYLSTGGARGAAVLAADAAFAHVLAERTAVVCRAAPYRPGEFRRRELPPLRAVLYEVRGLGLLVVEGYANLDPERPARPGGACARRVRHPGDRGGQVPVPHGYPCGADRARNPRPARCSSPQPGCLQPTRRIWSGAWPTGTGCPTRCAAPITSHGQARPQPPGSAASPRDLPKHAERGRSGRLGRPPHRVRWV